MGRFVKNAKVKKKENRDYRGKYAVKKGFVIQLEIKQRK
jgi:hypothetical protein